MVLVRATGPTVRAAGPTRPEARLGDRTRRPALPSRSVVAEWGAVLHRTIAGLPDYMLQALIRGLERHADELVAGRLYTLGGSGCAAGVMLRELDDPGCQRGLRFLIKHGWRRTSGAYKGLHKAQPRVRHLEFIFDGAVTLLREAEPELSEREACCRIGSWIRHATEDELLRRPALSASGDHTDVSIREGRR